MSLSGQPQSNRAEAEPRGALLGPITWADLWICEFSCVYLFVLLFSCSCLISLKKQTFLGGRGGILDMPAISKGLWLENWGGMFLRAERGAPVFS